MQPVRRVRRISSAAVTAINSMETATAQAIQPPCPWCLARSRTWVKLAAPARAPMPAMSASSTASAARSVRDITQLLSVVGAGLAARAPAGEVVVAAAPAPRVTPRGVAAAVGPHGVRVLIIGVVFADHG